MDASQLAPTDLAQHEYWMQQALELADQAQALGEVPIGALLVKDGVSWLQPTICGRSTTRPRPTPNSWPLRPPTKPWAPGA